MHRCKSSANPVLPWAIAICDAASAALIASVNLPVSA